MSLRFVSALGVVVLITLAWSVSRARDRFPWRAVLWGLFLQFILGIVILRTGPGQRLFHGFQSAVDRFTSFANEGNRLVFGPLAREDRMTQAFGEGNGVLLAVTFTGIIIFVSRCPPCSITTACCSGWSRPWPG
jgi:nucleoside permease NupC